MTTHASDVGRVPELMTDRLLLRGWRESDLEPFAELNADPRVTEFLPGPMTREATDALVERIVAGWSQHGFGLWAIERLDDRRFIGFTGLSRPRFEAPFTPAVEVGWRLAADAWGLGYATEAARASLRHGFEVLGLDEIVSFTVPANLRSRAVMDRIGMSRDPADDFEHPLLPEGHPLRAHLLYRIGRIAHGRADELVPRGQRRTGAHAESAATSHRYGRGSGSSR